MDQTANHSNFESIYQKQIWATYIKPILTQIASGQLNTSQIVDNLKKLHYHCQMEGTYKNRKLSIPTFKTLLALQQKSVPSIFAQISQYVLDYEHKNISIPLFVPQKHRQHTFFKDEVFLMMCFMSLMLVCQKDNFDFIFSEEEWKTKALIEYLKLQLASLSNLRKQFPEDSQFRQKLSKLTIKRKVGEKKIEEIIAEKQVYMSKATVAHDKDSIEDFFGSSKVDFANKFIGGGSLHTGCVQEEIMFVNHPQLYISMPLCEVMSDNEAIEFIGFEKYFKNTGYAFTCAFDGRETFKYEYDEKNRAKQYIVAIDAIPYFSESMSSVQFQKELIDREIWKAYIGFENSEGKDIVTGNWGCGCFNGNIPLKFMIQWIASSLANKQMVYVPFGYSDKVKKLDLFQRGKNLKVRKVYELIIKLGGELKDKKLNLMDLLNEEIKGI